MPKSPLVMLLQVPIGWDGSCQFLRIEKIRTWMAKENRMKKSPRKRQDAIESRKLMATVIATAASEAVMKSQPRRVAARA